jgi:hypothetical protein
MSVEKEMDSTRNESIGERYHFKSCESDQCKYVTVLGLGTGPSLKY